MALKQITITTLPVVRMIAGDPMATIRENGQISLSTAAAEALGATATHVNVLVDAEGHRFGFKGVDEKPKEGLPVNRAKKGKAVTISCAPALREHFPGYSYKEAGSQSYPAKVDAKKRIVVFEIPTKTPAPRPKRTRKRKTAETPAPTPAPAGEVTNITGDELEI